MAAHSEIVAAEPLSAPTLPIRDRALLWTGLAAITAISWLYLIRMPTGAGAMPEMNAMGGMLMPHQWSASEVWLTFAMWTVMMIAMMTPSASPMIATFARIARSRDAEASRAWLFAFGYLLAWIGFSAGATLLQLGLDRASLMSGSMRVTPIVGGCILIAAGIYQFTPLKSACLARCRSPIGFLMSEWRPGASGALTMGAKHGAHCIGCCWMLMALLFAAGVMNLVWIAIISGLVIVEKVAPLGRAIAAVAGVALAAWGVFVVGSVL